MQQATPAAVALDNAAFDLWSRRIDSHVDALIRHAEQCMHAPGAPAHVKGVEHHEGKLQALGLSKAEIYNFVNRAPMFTIE